MSFSRRGNENRPQRKNHPHIFSSLRIRQLLPGIFLCCIAAGISYGFNIFLPTVSPLLIAIILGIIFTNIVSLPASIAPGIDFSAKKLLRVGIIFLGLQLVIGDILSLGAPMLIVVVCIVAGGLIGTVFLGKLLRVPPTLSVLIACGFSICGAAAVAGASGVVDPNDEHEEDTVTAVALVVIFGTLMIPLVPLLARAFNLDTSTAALWAGGSIHEIAQVVAVGGIIGGGALTLAVIVKLARVLLLAPVVAFLSFYQRRTRIDSKEGDSHTSQAAVSRPPAIVPPFILGFLAMVALRSSFDLPDFLLTGGKVLQTVLLSAAMFGLGCGVKVRTLAKVGPRPFALAGLATLLVCVISYAGIMLVR